MKGTVHDGKITFPRQFIGTVNSFLTYFSGGTANREGQGEYTEDFTFLYDAESGTLTPENTHESLFITTFDYGNFNIFASPVLTPYEEVAATPVAPEIYDVSPSANLPGTLEIFYDVTNCDSEGHYLNPDKFSYVLYVNGQPYTFTAGPYRLQADRQELSLGFQNKYFTMHFECLGLFLQEKGVRTIGLQSIYRGGGEERRPPLSASAYPRKWAYSHPQPRQPSLCPSSISTASLPQAARGASSSAKARRHSPVKPHAAPAHRTLPTLLYDAPHCPIHP